MPDLWENGSEPEDRVPCNAYVSFYYPEDTVLCTRTAGHRGPHIAQGFGLAVVAVWSGAEETDPHD